MISKRISDKMSSGSMIRKMFEEGNRLKALYGAENVFDFSIGNPDLEPPREVIDRIKEYAAESFPGKHAYMSNQGYPSTCKAVADMLSLKSGLAVQPSGICMTVGAAGAMNAVLKAILDPGDEVIVLAPFFMEYLSYIDNHNGVPVIVPTEPDTFLPDLAKIDAAITDRTKAIIVNSPNNPSGVIYPATVLEALDTLLLSKNHVIHIISDEPYIDLAYDGKQVPCSMTYLTNVIVCFSWSKSLSLPGERIGYAAISPRHVDFSELCPAVVMCNRILGSVNAPAFFQKIIETTLYAKADIANYEFRRDLLYAIISEAGFTARKPDGALYLFPKAPVDDIAFVKACAAKNVLVVPGSAFSCPGYFRLAFCVSEATIRGSRDAFLAIGKEFGLN